MAYAERTEVPSKQSRMEIEELVLARGATSFMVGSDSLRAAVQCEMRGRRLRFMVPLPSVSDDRVKFKVMRGQKTLRTDNQRAQAVEAETRRRWRALLLVIKAKFEAVDSGIEAFDSAFLSNIVAPGSNQTLSELFVPQLEAAYKTGKPLPPLLGTG